MQYSDIKSEVAYKVDKRDPFERQDRTKSELKVHIDVAEIMKQKDHYGAAQEQPEALDVADPADLSEGNETVDLQEISENRGTRELQAKNKAKDEDENEEENVLSTVLDFLSTFIVALIVLIAAILVIGQLAGFHLFSVESGSMTPTYPVNSLVIVREVAPQTIEVGDVITFVASEDGMLVKHRVVSVDTSDKTFRTRGDANNVDDAEPVLWGNTVGKVMFGIPLLGRPFSIMTAQEYRKFMIGIIVFLLLLSMFWDFRKKEEKTKEKRRNETNKT